MASNSNKVTIDFSEWQTQSQFAQAHDLRLGTVSQWVKRLKTPEGIKNPQIKIWHIEQLGITLVKK